MLMPISWTDESNEDLHNIITTAVENSIIVRIYVLDNIIEFCILQRNLDIRHIRLKKENSNKALDVMRQNNCAIYWEDLWIVHLKEVDIRNGDGLSLNFRQGIFYEEYEQLLEYVKKIRLTKISISSIGLYELTVKYGQEYIDQLMQNIVDIGRTTVGYYRANSGEYTQI